MVTRSVCWRRFDGTAMETCRLMDGQDPTGPSLEGTVVGTNGPDPFVCRYGVGLDDAWQTRRVAIHVVTGDAGPRTFLIIRDEASQWAIDGAAVPGVAGAIDIDLTFTPATNTLPIRRLGLSEGESAEVVAAWFRFPEMRLEPLRQRYTRVGPTTYRYQSDNGFEATLATDDQGLVVTYEDGWERVGSA